jgi:hypothetical protein
MPVWCHRIVAMLVYFVTFVVAILAVALFYRWFRLFDAWGPVGVITILSGMVLFLMYFLGLPLASALEQSLPVRCPACGQRTMRAGRRAIYQPLRYCCLACGHRQGRRTTSG